MKINWKTVEEHGWPEEYKECLVTNGKVLWSDYFDGDEWCWDALKITHYCDDHLDKIELPEEQR